MTVLGLVLGHRLLAVFALPLIGLQGTSNSIHGIVIVNALVRT
jgi:hypothetical protein